MRWPNPANLSARLLVAAAVAVPLATAAVSGLVGRDQPPIAPESKLAPTPRLDTLATELDRQMVEQVVPFVAKYCLSCHSGEDAKADLRLDQLSSTGGVVTGVTDLRLLREMISTGEMPPKKKLQPSEDERLRLSQWADAALNYVPADAVVDPGWFTIHRLNRSEYRATLRDLLGINSREFDVAAKMPIDDTGYGFDNIADVLSTSPLAVEQYIEAAEEAIERALGPVLEIGDHPRLLRPIEGGAAGHALPQGGFFLFTNGGATARLTAPVAGDYFIRVRAWETHAGDENANLSLWLDEKELKGFLISARQDQPQEIEYRTRLEAGQRTIGAWFTNDFYVKDKGDRNLGIESISIAGPLDEASTQRPDAWLRIFGAASALSGDDARAKAILTAFATRAYRKPASSEQVQLLMRVYQSERAAGQTFEPAVRTGLTATLVSPSFLFRTVSNPQAGNPKAIFRLDSYELASRLSYFLWSSMPDEVLLAAAADGSLLTDIVLSGQVRRMLADPRSSAFIENFSGQWLQLRSLEGMAIDRAQFPEYNDELRAAMTTEATMFFADVLRSDRSVLDFISSPDSFLNERLASFYGIPDIKGVEFHRVTLPEDSPRGGVLTMGAVLTLTSNTTRTSPVKRGLFVLDQILGAPPPPPPSDIPPLEQSAHVKAGATVREQLAIHVANPSCAACHNRLDPLGLSFENFDAIGRWRDLENGRPIDASGTLPGGAVINGSGDLKTTLLARGDQFIEALSGKVLTYAIGRGTEPFDRPAIRQIATRVRTNGDRFSALIEAVVLSDTFRTCRARNSNRE